MCGTFQIDCHIQRCLIKHKLLCYILKDSSRLAGGSLHSDQNESRVAQIPAVALLWLRRRRRPPPRRSSCSAAARAPTDRPTEPEGPFSFFDLIWGLRLAAVAAEDNLRPKENTDAKISHGNLGPSRFELVRRLDKYKLRAPPATEEKRRDNL